MVCPAADHLRAGWIRWLRRGHSLGWAGGFPTPHEGSGAGDAGAGRFVDGENRRLLVGRALHVTSVYAPTTSPPTIRRGGGRRPQESCGGDVSGIDDFRDSRFPAWAIVRRFPHAEIFLVCRLRNRRFPHTDVFRWRRLLSETPVEDDGVRRKYLPADVSRCAGPGGASSSWGRVRRRVARWRGLARAHPGRSACRRAGRGPARSQDPLPGGV